MSDRYVVKPRASRDLDAYAGYLSEESGLDTALKFLHRARNTFVLLSTQPHMGWRLKTAYPGLGQLRVFRVKGFHRMLILYRPAQHGIEIVRVIHGSRRVRTLLRREGLE